MRLGDVRLRLVSDGAYWLDGAGPFGLVPKVEWEEIAQPDEKNRIRVEQWCLLVETGTQRILVDTGNGDKLATKEREFMDLEEAHRLLDGLADYGVGPEDVDVVINTHLHGDHCGGNTRYDLNGELTTTFPRALYYVQRIELADALFPNERTRVTYRRENIEPVERAGQLRVLWGDTRLSDEIRVMVTPGHTPAHQSVVIESGGKTAIFLADVAQWPLHMEDLSIVPAYDVQPLVTIETKRGLARWAIENEVLLIFDHHPVIVAGYLNPTGQKHRFRLEPVEMRPDGDES